MNSPARLVFTFAVCLAAVRPSLAQMYAIGTGIQDNIQNQGPGRRMQQAGFSPFDSATKMYGYSGVQYGRHLLDSDSTLEGENILGEQGPSRSLLQAYSPAAYAASSLGRDPEGSARRRRMMQEITDIGAALTVAGPAYGGYGGRQSGSYGQARAYGGYGGF